MGVLRMGATATGTGSTRSMYPARAGSAASRWTAGRWRWPAAGGGSARWRTGARIRAARSVRARSRRAGCAAPGTATTTTRSPAGRRRDSPTGRVLRGAGARRRRLCAGCPAASGPARTVGDVLVETLVAFGITHVFGMVGHSNLGFADAMRRAEERGELTYIGIRHEGAAAFAASAYGKLTGRPAACFAIAGPGSTNLLTGLYDAKLDQAPVLAISGQVPSSVARARRLPGPRPDRRVRRRRRLDHRPCTAAATTASWPRWR